MANAAKAGIDQYLTDGLRLYNVVARNMLHLDLEDVRDGAFRRVIPAELVMTWKLISPCTDAEAWAWWDARKGLKPQLESD